MSPRGSGLTLWAPPPPPDPLDVVVGQCSSERTRYLALLGADVAANTPVDVVQENAEDVYHGTPDDRSDLLTDEP